MAGTAEIFLGFARALRAAGVAVTADRERTYLEAVAAVGADDQSATYFAGRATLCASPIDLETYDRVYAAWFSRQSTVPRQPPPMSVVIERASLDADDTSGGEGSGEDEAVAARASRAEVLRQRDVASLSAREKHAITSHDSALAARLRKGG